MRIGHLKWVGLAAVLAGCASGGGQSGVQGGNTGKTFTVGIVFDSGGRGDKSFNDSAWAGVQRAEKELGTQSKPVDSKSEKDYETNLTALSDQGADIVFAVGFAQKNALSTVAPKYTSVRYGLIDDTLDLPNVRSLVFAEEQGSFLAGYLAALVSQSGKIGFVGGKTTPLIKKFEDGYIAGAKTAKPSIDVLPSKYTESWDDTNLGKVSAESLFQSGADIVYHAAGRCGLGVIAAAKEAGKYAIGVDSDQDDQAPGTVLTSMIKHVDVAVFETIRDVKDGKFTPGVRRFDLKDGGVGLSDMKYTKDKIPAGVLEKLDGVKQQIIDGKIKPPSTDDELKSYLAGLPKS